MIDVGAGKLPREQFSAGTITRSRIRALFILTSWLLVFTGFAKASGSVGTDGTVPKNQIIATVPVGIYPWGIAVSPDSSTVYVANLYPNTVTVIDAKNGYRSKATIKGLFGPSIVATNRDGTVLYVATAGTPGAVAVIDAARTSYPVLANITVGTYPEGMALSPNGKQLYVTNYGFQSFPGTVSVISTETNQVTATIVTHGNPFLVFFISNGEQADVLNAAGTGFLQFVNSVTGAVSSSVGAGGVVNSPAGMVADQSGGTVYMADYENSVVVAKGNDGTVQKTILTASSPYSAVTLGQPALTPNGKYLYVPRQYDGATSTPVDDVVMIETGTGHIASQSISVGGDPLWAQAAPDGKTLYVGNIGNNTVTVVDISP
jgi:YVTN family beta-propeller protein